jgi:hypothetical protein
VWELFTVVATQRKRREIDPMITALRRFGQRLAPEQLGTAGDERVGGRRQRVADLLAFLGLVDTLAQRFFESHKSLRAALELLAQKDGTAGPAQRPGRRS